MILSGFLCGAKRRPERANIFRDESHIQARDGLGRGGNGPPGGETPAEGFSGSSPAASEAEALCPAPFCCAPATLQSHALRFLQLVGIRNGSGSHGRPQLHRGAAILGAGPFPGSHAGPGSAGVRGQGSGPVGGRVPEESLEPGLEGSHTHRRGRLCPILLKEIVLLQFQGPRASRESVVLLTAPPKEAESFGL